eukprot:TRINITY_DN7954_c0_g1_i4.p1 TRINITY_DN7954_c0_g1~~TRINITY_DN7954_c0_g1_i4.p1  ORF type:complete len:230 (+),score=37.20 TRINITY_DN7954_c0_g1_i4:45-734(+)
MLAESVEEWHPKRLREAIRSKQWGRTTSGMCAGYLQTNIVFLPKSVAADFRSFCELNSQACPLVLQQEPGNPVPSPLALDADMRTDVAKYRVFRSGRLEEETYDISQLFQSDTVTFHLGCSFSFERALMREGLPVRNVEEKKNVSMYITNIECKAVGPFHTNMVVSMRPIPKGLLHKVADVTKHSKGHGSPIHIGDPSTLGIEDLSKVDFGDSVTINPDEVPVFWACGN